MESVRIQKYLSDCGVLSRRAAEKAIENGEITVNGEVATIGLKINPMRDKVQYKGKNIIKKRNSHYNYIMLHKPRGYVTTLSDEKGRKDITQLITGCSCRVYPVGRLDMDSEGLLILTNDGDFANKLMHPKHEVNKTYRVYVKNYSQEGFDKLCQPVTLDGYTIKKPGVRLISSDTDGNAWLEVVIHEGRNRQVRRMCDLAGMHVVRLIRIAEGDVRLGKLPLGKWRYLTADEVETLTR